MLKKLLSLLAWLVRKDSKSQKNEEVVQTSTVPITNTWPTKPVEEPIAPTPIKSTSPKYMISRKELNPKGFPLTEEQEKYQQILYEAINKVRTAYGKPMYVTSGVRSMEDHLRIYKEKGITDPAKIPMASRHLIGAAVDIADSDSSLWNWCMDNIKVLEEAGLYLEDKSATPTWVHFQCTPPKSGKRIFKP